MNKWFQILIMVTLVLLILFLPDIIPECSCCKKLKLRPFFRIHKSVSMNPGYKGCRSICRKCCRKYELDSLDKLDRLLAIRRKVKINMLKKDS